MKDPRIDKTNYIDFTEPKKIEQLKAAYDNAKALGLETFMFEKNEILTAYAYYMIQYLEMKDK
jgi:hypothetical protein